MQGRGEVLCILFSLSTIVLCIYVNMYICKTLYLDFFPYENFGAVFFTTVIKLIGSLQMLKACMSFIQ